MKSTYIVPHWSNIKLVDYLKFHKKLAQWENHPEYSEKLITLVASHIFKIPVDSLRDLPEHNIEEISEYAVDLIVASKETPLVKTFYIQDNQSDNKVKLGFIPDLEEMSYGEYLDLVELCKNTWDNIPEIMTILYRPIIKENNGKYQIAKYSKRDQSVIDLFEKSLTMDIVFGAIGFFFRLSKELNRTFLHSLKEMVVDPEVISHLKGTLQQNGEAMELLSSLQMETQQS